MSNEEKIESTVEAPVSEPTVEVESKETILTPDVSKAEVPVSNDFLSGVSEELRENPSLRDFKNVDGLAKSYVEAQKMIGNSVRIPSDDASVEVKQEFYNKLESMPDVLTIPKSDDVEGINKFYNKLGRPEKAEGYDFVFEQKELNDIIASAPEIGQEFSVVAHNLGLSKSQAKALVEFEAGKVYQHNEDRANKREQSLLHLKKEWGNDYDARLHGAKSVAKIYQEKYPDAMTELLNGPAGDNPALIEMLSELGGVLKETDHKGISQTVKYGTSKQEALSRIQEIRTNPNHPINLSNHPDRERQQQKINELYKIAYGTD